MSESRTRKRRSSSNRTKEQLETAVWVVFTVAIFGGVATGGLYLFKHFSSKPTKQTEATAAANPAKGNEERPVAAVVPPSSGASFGDIIHESYFFESIVNWRPEGQGRLTSTKKDSKYELRIEGDRAVLTAEATIARDRDGSINSTKLLEFSAYLSPNLKPRKDRLGAAGMDEWKALSGLHSDAASEFGKKRNEPSPSSTVTRRGKTVEATAAFAYDEAAKKVTYRPEVKRLGG